MGILALWGQEWWCAVGLHWLQLCLFTTLFCDALLEAQQIATAGVFIPQKLVNAKNQGFLYPTAEN